MEGPRSCSTCGTLLPPRSGNGDPRPRCRKCIKASEPDRLGWTTPHCCASCHRWLLPEKFSRTQQRLGKRARCMTCALEHTQLRRGVSVAQMQIDQIQQQQQQQQQQIQVLQTQQHVQPQQQQQQQQPLLGDSLSRVPPEGPLDLTLPFTMLNVKSPQPTQQQHKQEHSQLGHHFGSTPLPIPIPPVQAPAASMLAGDILSLLLGTHPNTNNTNNTTTYTKSQSWIGPAGPKPHPIHNVHPGYQLQHQHHPQQQDSLTRSPRSEPSPIISAPHLAHPGKFPPSLPPPPMMGLAELLNAPGPLTVPTTTASQAATTTSQLFRADTTDTHESAFTTSAMVLCRGPCGRLCVASDTIGQPFPEPWCSSCVGALLALLKANN